MKTAQFNLEDADQTRRLGQKIANDLHSTPALIFLRGELGAGKTTLAQGFIGSLLKDEQRVLSPTYTYMQSYDHGIPIYHFDLFRLDDADALSELGLDSFIDDEQAIRLIEWPERMGDRERHPNLEIHLIKKGLRRQALVKYF